MKDSFFPTESSSWGSQDVYWANEQGLDLAAAVMRRAKFWYKRLPSTLMFQRWVKGWRAFCGLPGNSTPFDVSQLAFVGAEAEQVVVRVNHIGSLGRTAVQVVCQQRPELQPVASNSDYSSEAQADVCKGILGYLIKHERKEEYWERATTIAVACGETWTSDEWDASWGPVYATDPATGTQLHEGRFLTYVFMPWDVVVDLHRQDPNHEWAIEVIRVNKWNLAAKYPALADRILALTDQTRMWLPESKPDATISEQVDNDYIPMFVLFHDKTDAVPDGRWAVALDDDLLLAEGPLPYDSMPLQRHTAGELLGTSAGDSPLLHGLALNELLDQVVSSLGSNEVNFNRQSVVSPKGYEYSRTELAEGMSWFEVEPLPNGELPVPKAIQLNASSQTSYTFVNAMSQTLTVLTGVQPVMTGSDPSLQGRLSGAAMVLLESQTLRYLNGLQASRVRMIEGSGTRMVQILKRYARSPKIARIAGKAKAFMLKEFTGKDFEGIDRVEVLEGNPGLRTPAFNISIAQDLLNRPGSDITTKQYLELVTTGNLDIVTEPDLTERMNIRRENELLREGQQPSVMMTDDPAAHIKGHLSLLDDPAARDDPKVVWALLGNPQTGEVGHIQAHMEAWKNADPVLLQLLGLPPPPPPPPPPGMPPPGMPPGPPGPPGPGAGPPPGPPGPPPGAHHPSAHGPGLARLMAPGPNSPSPAPPMMPKNPMSGQRPPLPPGSSGRG